MTSRTGRGVLALACLCSIFTALRPASAAASWLSVFVALIAVVAIFAGIFLYRPRTSINEHLKRREPWDLVGLAMCLLFGNIVAKSFAPDLDAFLYPILLTCAMVIVGKGLIAMLLERLPARGEEHVLEAIVAAIVISYGTWMLFVAPSMNRDTAIFLSELLALIPAMCALALLLTTIELLRSFEVRPTAYYFVAGALGAHLLASSFSGAAILLDNSLIGQFAPALSILALGLWASAALHPSMGRHDEPAAPKQSDSSRSHLVFAIESVVVGPLMVAIAAMYGLKVGFWTNQVGATALPLLVVIHLVKILQTRSWNEHQVQHDDLTGLPNRVLFGSRLDSALSFLHRTGGMVAVMYLDLDRFKTINDSLGHGAGNQVLQQVANRLEQTLGLGNTVARLGGDEFAILLPHVRSSRDATDVAKEVLESLRPSITVGRGHELFTSTSIGIALAPMDGVTAEALLTNADTALYQAKDNGRNTFQLYTLEMGAQAQRRISLESSLRRAMNEGELEVYYQPKVSLRTSAIVGTEALVRWRHPELGFLLPMDFIPMAEETGLIVPLGEWVLEQACLQTYGWHKKGFENLTVAVNLSARQFHQQHVETMVAKVLRTTGLDPTRLELEITESLAMGGGDLYIASLLDLKSIGVTCSIDDFGTGYSSLSYLTRFPVDTLKIDKSFVQQISRRYAGDTAIVGAVIAMAHSLNLKVVAEGVETEEQLNFLIQHDCDEMQGYLVSPPIPGPEMELMLTKQSRRNEAQREPGDRGERTPSWNGTPAPARKRLGSTIATALNRPLT